MNPFGIVAFCGVLFCTTTSLFAQSSPLIMRHADSLAVSQKAGHLVLNGRVHFIHDSIQFRTQRAVWNKDVDLVQCDGGFLFTHPDGFIQARSGNYRKKTETATATGDVTAKDSAGTYAFFGQYLIYDKQKEFLILPEKPLLHQYEKRKDKTIDTVAVKAKYITYDKKNEFAQAFREVVVTEKDYVITCDTAFLDKKNNWLALKGHPKCVMKNYELTGDSIYLVIDSESRMLRSALVIRNAHGKQHEPGKKGKPDQFTEATGDTLFAEFKNNKMLRLYVNINAHGLFYESDLAKYQNLMDGSRLDLSFEEGKLQKAVIAGEAKSTYFHVKNDRSIAGRNESAGDTIYISFEDSKVKHLKMVGDKTLASGRYFDLEKEKIKGSMNPSQTKKDSTRSPLKHLIATKKKKAQGETQK